MSDLTFINDFWVQMCPFFTDFKIVYFILDIITILAFIRVFLFLPAFLLNGSKKKI